MSNNYCSSTNESGRPAHLRNLIHKSNKIKPTRQPFGPPENLDNSENFKARIDHRPTRTPTFQPNRGYYSFLYTSDEEPEVDHFSWNDQPPKPCSNQPPPNPCGCDNQRPKPKPLSFNAQSYKPSQYVSKWSERQIYTPEHNKPISVLASADEIGIFPELLKKKTLPVVGNYTDLLDNNPIYGMQLGKFPPELKEILRSFPCYMFEFEEFLNKVYREREVTSYEMAEIFFNHARHIAMVYLTESKCLFNNLYGSVLFNNSLLVIFALNGSNLDIMYVSYEANTGLLWLTSDNQAPVSSQRFNDLIKKIRGINQLKYPVFGMTDAELQDLNGFENVIVRYFSFMTRRGSMINFPPMALNAAENNAKQIILDHLQSFQEPINEI